ncbi:streptomycin biosynthesis protein [Plantactinospora sp. BC1]|nr:streptomycin biosynthesis protein [Plantactinospora sp. BC1]AVT41803.1 streptomycin biosynthesis protein [Plantactinospora sp. BB1]
MDELSSTEVERPEVVEDSRSAPVVKVAVAALRVADSPRLNGVDSDHVRALTEVESGLPAIFVHRQTMRVIDGMHRLTAARLMGRDRIDVQFFDGDEADAFRLAVKANVTHGLPLTLAERQAAAARIIHSHPELSDRAIASTAGLAAKTVAAIRLRSAVQPSPVRIGRDGRARPLNAAEGRRLASQVIAARPGLSLREIARAAGISVGTARDVRERIRAGQDPVPPRQRNACDAGSGRAVRAEPRATGPVALDPVDTRALLEGLRRDPSLRYTESGRHLLRWLSTRTVAPAEWRQAVDAVSPHCAILIERIARECARVWIELADELDQRSADRA